MEYDFKTDLFQCLRFIQEKLSILHERRVDFYDDPFIVPLIKAICYAKIKDVKTKFRVRDKQCSTLMGVIDPYFCLEPGEVFIQINPFIKDQRK